MTVAEFTPVWSVAGANGDICGEIALQYLPPRSSPTESVLVACGGVRSADAWSFAVLRTLLEYAASRLLIPVTLALPSDEDARITLATGIGSVPNGVQLARDTIVAARRDANVVLPATRVPTLALAELLAAHLPDTPQSAGASRRELSYLALAYQELLTNALVHSNSPVDAVGAVALEPEQDELQVVVCDLGDTISFHPDAATRLEGAWQARVGGGGRVSGGLPSIIALAERRRLDVSVGIYAGTGRLVARSGGSLAVTSEEPYIPGFTVAVTLHR